MGNYIKAKIEEPLRPCCRNEIKVVNRGLIKDMQKLPECSDNEMMARIEDRLIKLCGLREQPNLDLVLQQLDAMRQQQVSQSLIHAKEIGNLLQKVDNLECRRIEQIQSVERQVHAIQQSASEANERSDVLEHRLTCNEEELEAMKRIVEHGHRMKILNEETHEDTAVPSIEEADEIGDQYEYCFIGESGAEEIAAEHEHHRFASLPSQLEEEFEYVHTPPSTPSACDSVPPYYKISHRSNMDVFAPETSLKLPHRRQSDFDFSWY